MGVLANARRELFAQYIAEGMKQNEAYIKAGFDSSNLASAAVGGCRLRDIPEVEKRIDEIMNRGAKLAERRIALKRVDILQMLLDDRKFAIENGQASAAIKATELLGKDLGMFVDRKEIKTGALDDVDIGELDRVREELIRESARRIATATGGSDSRPEDRAVLPGDRIAAPGAVPEAHAVLHGGDAPQAAADLSA